MERPSGKVVYEVNLSVNKDIVPNFLEWLSGHMEQVIACKGFEGAELFQEETTEAAERSSFVVQYRVSSREALQEYFDQHAPALRQQGLDMFGDKFSATRRILLVTERAKALPQQSVFGYVH
ncbi:hypothetical protein QOT17_007502 [Balamuthia mandrillaris]